METISGTPARLTFRQSSMNSSTGVSDQVSQFISPRAAVPRIVGRGSTAGFTDTVFETMPPAPPAAAWSISSPVRTLGPAAVSTGFLNVMPFTVTLSRSLVMGSVSLSLSANRESLQHAQRNLRQAL